MEGFIVRYIDTCSKIYSKMYVVADMVVIVGDLVDGYVHDLKEAVKPVRDIKAKYGPYFVTGIVTY
jgi:predicted MPP superfamily phosphohydrolase